MVCCLFGTKPLSKPMVVYGELEYWARHSAKFEWNTTILMQEIEFESAIGKTAIRFSRPLCERYDNLHLVINTKEQ